MRIDHLRDRGSYCALSGNRCYVSRLYCAAQQVEPPPIWVRGVLFSQRWKLVAVKVTRTPRA